MTTVDQTPKKRGYKPNLFERDVFTPLVTSDTVTIPFNQVDINIKDKLHSNLVGNIEGKCIKDGFVQPGSVKIETYSAGTFSGPYVKYDIVYSCMVCYPVESMELLCTVINVTKAGIRAELTKYDPTPMVIFVARDHHYSSEVFNKTEPNTQISVKVVGTRFEIGDRFISVIAEMS